MSKNKVSEDRYAIYVDNENLDTQSLICDLCKCLIRQKDFETVQKYGVCYDCKVDFVEYDIEGWLNGDRPTHEVISNKLEKRLENPYFFMRDRPV